MGLISGRKHPARTDADDSITSRVDRMQRREYLSCAFCPPHAGENASRHPKRGVQKPRERLRRKKAHPPERGGEETEA